MKEHGVVCCLSLVIFHSLLRICRVTLHSVKLHAKYKPSLQTWCRYAYDLLLNFRTIFWVGIIIFMLCIKRQRFRYLRWFFQVHVTVDYCWYSLFWIALFSSVLQKEKTTLPPRNTLFYYLKNLQSQCSYTGKWMDEKFKANGWMKNYIFHNYKLFWNSYFPLINIPYTVPLVFISTNAKST